jgi:DNA-binding IclR family transcriptional regulator
VGRGKTTATVERAADLLLLFMEMDRPSLGVTEIADELGLSKAAVHRILTSLRLRGFVELNDESRYRLGPSALSLGLAYLHKIDYRELAAPELLELSKASNETATLSIRSGFSRVYVEQVTPPREVKMVVDIGRQFSLHAGASSKAFLAFLAPDEQDEVLGGSLPALTEHTVTDAVVLRRQLERVRKRGFATSFGERQAGAATIAAPVFDYDARPVAVVSVCGPDYRFRREVASFAEPLLAATGRLSKRLGYRPVAPAAV